MNAVNLGNELDLGDAVLGARVLEAPRPERFRELRRFVPLIVTQHHDLVAFLMRVFHRGRVGHRSSVCVQLVQVLSPNSWQVSWESFDRLRGRRRRETVAKPPTGSSRRSRPPPAPTTLRTVPITTSTAPPRRRVSTV